MNCDDIMKAHQSEHEKNTASVPLSTKQPGNLASFAAGHHDPAAVAHAGRPRSRQSHRPLGRRPGGGGHGAGGQQVQVQA